MMIVRKSRKKENKKYGRNPELMRRGINSSKCLKNRSRQPCTIDMGPVLICPDRVTVCLSFLDVSRGSLNNAGQHTANIRYQPTAAYDIDPTLGGTNMAGFNEWTAFYNYYRVLAFSTSIVFTNAEAFGMIVFAIPMNQDPGGGISEASVQSKLMNPYCVQKPLGPKTGADTVVLRQSIDCRQFVGATSQRYDDSYAALNTSNPANNIYLVTGLYSQANTLVNGAQYEFRCSVEIEFYDRNDLTA
jgi:hypothetical protein